MLVDRSNGLGVIVLMNGPGEDAEETVAFYALQLLRASRSGQALPGVPPVDLTRVENAAEYAGVYQASGEHGQAGGSKDLTLAARGDHLELHYGGQRLTLEPRGSDRFYVDHPDFSRYLLCVGRENGQVVQAFHGPRWYTHPRYSGPTTFDYPRAWEAYTGRYHCHNPEMHDFRVVLRKGTLTLIYAAGNEEPLVPVGVAPGEAVFRLGRDARSPEWVRFETIVGGQALRASVSCAEYYRV
jgi:hypothetical protein